VSYIATSNSRSDVFDVPASRSNAHWIGLQTMHDMAARS
jgi:hypothetical protein